MYACLFDHFRSSFDSMNKLSTKKRMHAFESLKDPCQKWVVM